MKTVAEIERELDEIRAVFREVLSSDGVSPNEANILSFDMAAGLAEAMPQSVSKAVAAIRAGQESGRRRPANLLSYPQGPKRITKEAEQAPR